MIGREAGRGEGARGVDAGRDGAGRDEAGRDGAGGDRAEQGAARQDAAGQDDAWQVLGAGHLDAIEHLHRLSIGSAGPDVVKPETRDFFAGLLAGRGRILGCFDRGALIAYGVLQTEILAYDDPRAELGYAADRGIAKLAGAAVAPSHRGAGLQRASIRQRVALAGDTPLLFSTAAPGNTASLQNLQAEGFEIRATVTRYGGLQRYLLLRECRAGDAAAGASGAAR